MNSRLEKMLPVVSLFFSMCFFASSFIALKVAFRHYDPMFVIFGRMVVAAFCFLLLFGKIGKIDYRKGDWRYFVVMSLCEPCFYFMFEAKALENTTASQAGMITAILPLLVAVGAWFFLKERLTVRTTLGFVIAVSGACLLSVGGEASESAPNPVLGNLFEFCAMMMAAGYTLILKKLTARYSAFFLTAIQPVAGILFFGALLCRPGAGFPTVFEPAGAGAILYLGGAVTLFAYFLYNYGVSKMNASTATAYINLIPLITVILGWVILGERFTPVQYVAAAAVFVGIYLSQERGNSCVEEKADMGISS